MSINDKGGSVSQKSTSGLKKIRIWLASFVLIAMSLLFVGVLKDVFAFLAHIQLVPVILSGGFAVATAIAAITLIFGRIYCSVVCPLGLLQDVFSWFGKKQRFQFTRNKFWLRLGTSVIFVIAVVFGISSVFGLFDPYSIFGRICSELFAPAWAIAWSVLSIVPDALGIHLISAPTFIWLKGFTAATIAACTFLFIGLLAYKWGRIWCNTICPVGAGLGFLAKYSFLKIKIIPHHCVKCGICASTCKASCINARSGTIDASRCVMCFNCLENCKRGAIVYAPMKRKNTEPYTAYIDNGRRNFIYSAFGFAAIPITAALTAKKTEIMALAGLEQKMIYPSGSPVLPPGVWDFQRFRERCTSCQLCVSVCPANILRPHEQDGMLQPSLSFDRGYCWEDCVACSNICPTSAISPISIMKKKHIQLGYAIHDRQLCTVCEACVQNCPNEAIRLQHARDGTEYVAVDADHCTGCGACEYFCPQAAIYVRGCREHRRLMRQNVERERQWENA